jgi:FtsH-binding integral membrane protein
MDRSAKATKLKMIDDAKQLTREDKRNNYRRGSVVDRWRRASMFDEIVQAQSQDRASRSDNNRGEAARISQIQGAKSIGLSRDHRARMIAFEMAADHIRHHETKDTDEDTEWVGLNPFCVASMPEDIRRGFLTKVFGILFLQLFFTTVIVCVIKYSGLGEVLNATFWAVWIIFIMPYILVGVLLCVRKKHPVNLIVFTAFSVSIAFMLGLAIYGLADSLFIVTMGGMCAMVGGIAAFARKPMDDFNFYNSFYIVGLSVVLTLIISLSLYPGLLWHFYIWPPFATLLFGVWIIWDIVAIQIDLTPDEYIIGALDIYLDIINMILWMLVCCLYCLESVAKCAG